MSKLPLRRLVLCPLLSVTFCAPSDAAEMSGREVTLPAGTTIAANFSLFAPSAMASCVSEFLASGPPNDVSGESPTPHRWAIAQGLRCSVDISSPTQAKDLSASVIITQFYIAAPTYVGTSNTFYMSNFIDITARSDVPVATANFINGTATLKEGQGIVIRDKNLSLDNLFVGPVSPRQAGFLADALAEALSLTAQAARPHLTLK